MQIRAIDLTKKFASKTAVDSISFEIRNGQILGLLGPNGAGKSTTIKMLSGQSRPTSGTIEIDGTPYSEVPGNFRSLIGVMPQEVVIWDDLTVKENIFFTGTLFGIRGAELKQRASRIISELNLASELNTVAKNLSGGFKRRLNLAITIINEPGAVFLDEPTPGIDPQNRRFLWEYITNLRNSNRSVILTDHYLDEAEKLADYVVIIDYGKIIAEGTVKELKDKHGNGHLVVVNFDDDNDSASLNKFSKLITAKFPSAKSITSGLTIQTKDPMDVMKFTLNSLEEHGINYQDLELKEPTLEDIFLILTGKNIRE